MPGRAEREGHFISVVALPKTHNRCLTMRKTSDKPKLEDILEITSLALLKVVPKRESLQACHRLEQPKEKRQLNVLKSLR